MAQPIIQLIPYDAPPVSSPEYANMIDFFKLYLLSVTSVNPDNITPIKTITYKLLAECMIARLFKRDIEIAAAAAAAAAAGTVPAITVDNLLEDIKTNIDLNTQSDVLTTTLKWLTLLPNTELAHGYIRQIIDLLNIDKGIGTKIYLDPNYAQSWQTQKKAMVYLQIITLKEPEQDAPNIKMEALQKNHLLHKKVLEQLAQSGGTYQVSKNSNQLCTGVFCNTCTFKEFNDHILNTCIELKKILSIQNQRNRNLTIITELSNLNSKLTICTISPHLKNKQPINNFITYISGLLSSQSIINTDFNIQEFINLLEKLIIEVGASEQSSAQSSVAQQATVAAQRLEDARQQQLKAEQQQLIEARQQQLAQQQLAQQQLAQQQLAQQQLAQQQLAQQQLAQQQLAQQQLETLRKEAEDVEAQRQQAEALRLEALRLEALRKAAAEALRKAEYDAKAREDKLREDQEKIKRTQEQIFLQTAQLDLLEKHRALRELLLFCTDYLTELDNLIEKYNTELVIQQQLASRGKVKITMPIGFDDSVTMLKKHITKLRDKSKKLSTFNSSDIDTTSITILTEKLKSITELTIEFKTLYETNIDKYKKIIQDWLEDIENYKQIPSQIVLGAASSSGLQGAASLRDSSLTDANAPSGLPPMKRRPLTATASASTSTKYLKYKNKYLLLKNKIFKI
jgi:hypothetical protein